MKVLGESHKLQLELRFDGTAPIGSVCVDGGDPHSFSGWVGLVGTIDELVNEDRERGAG